MPKENTHLHGICLKMGWSIWAEKWTSNFHERESMTSATYIVFVAKSLVAWYAQIPFSWLHKTHICWQHHWSWSCRRRSTAQSCGLARSIYTSQKLRWDTRYSTWIYSLWFSFTFFYFFQGAQWKYTLRNDEGRTFERNDAIFLQNDIYQRKS